MAFIGCNENERKCHQIYLSFRLKCISMYVRSDSGLEMINSFAAMKLILQKQKKKVSHPWLHVQTLYIAKIVFHIDFFSCHQQHI